MRHYRLVFVLAGLIAIACGDNSGADVDADAGTGDAGIDAGADPNSLRLTGLWSDFDEEVLADGVLAYEPQFVLWSDGSAKRRWIWIPSGGVIDTSNMDAWQVPVGTKLWKEFTRDSVRVETRLMERTSETEWEFSTYAWNEEGTDAIRVEGFAGVENVLGTDHDIPGPDDCNECHRKTQQYVLGFGAVQLDYVPSDPAFVDIDELDDAGLLSVSPQGGSIPHYGLPGNANERAALGYVHVNCGNCHNSSGLGVGVGVPIIDYWYSVDTNNFGQTGLAATVGQVGTFGTMGATAVVEAGAPETSAMYLRMKQELRGKFGQMPKIGTELEDPMGLAVISTWIGSL